MECDSIIFDVIVDDKHNAVLVICELDVLSVTHKGESLWIWSSDSMMTDYTLSNGKLIIFTDEDEDVHIQINDGTYVNAP